MVSVFALMILLLLSSEYALKRFSESLLSETLETPVEIENVSIDLLEGTLSFHNTRIANLKGFSKPNIFTAETVRATGSFADFLLQGHIHIQMIEIDHIQTWIQKNSDGYNYEVLLRNLGETPEDASGADDPEETNPAENRPSTDNDSDIEIREIRLTDVRTAVYDFIPSAHSTPESRESNRLDLEWDTMILRNINLGEGGREAARHLSQLITEALLTATAKKVGTLPIHLVEQGFSLGDSTLKIIGQETHTDEIGDTFHDLSRGAAEWLHRLVPHNKEEKPQSSP